MKSSRAAYVGRRFDESEFLAGNQRGAILDRVFGRLGANWSRVLACALFQISPALPEFVSWTKKNGLVLAQVKITMTKL